MQGTEFDRVSAVLGASTDLHISPEEHHMLAMHRALLLTRGMNDEGTPRTQGAEASALAFHSLSQIARAAQIRGLDLTELLAVISDVFDRTPAAGSLTQSEADFLGKHGGVGELGPEHAVAFHRIAAQTALEDLRDSLTADDVAEGLNRDRSRVRHSKRAGDLYAISIGGQQQLRYPAWQFTKNSDGRLAPLPHLPAIIKAIADSELHPSTVAGIMTDPQEDLVVKGQPVTPVQWLTTGGDVDAVTDLVTDPIAW